MASTLVDVGYIDYSSALNWGFSGVMLRGAGINWDLRKLGMFNNAYNSYTFQVPLGSKSDCYERFLIRVEEMRESLNIIKQCIDTLPEGPFLGDNLKMIAPSRYQMKNSMESLINHFKLYSEGSLFYVDVLILVLKHLKVNLYLYGDF